jgi:hypothetical protein
MVRPYIADGEACIQTWEVAANIFNEQSQAANNDWDSNPWDGQGAKTPSHKNTYITKYYIGLWVWADSKHKIYFCGASKVRIK